MGFPFAKNIENFKEDKEKEGGYEVSYIPTNTEADFVREWNKMKKKTMVEIL